MFNFIKRYFINHPKSVCMTYKEHMLFSLGLSYIFIEASYKAFIHGFLPNVYITSSSDTSKKISYLLENSGCRDKK